ncbi:type II toxin-antitoxin system HicB family antitoxin [Microbulbifer sp. 2205BS26-8]|uniref:type II toxin-antitoxin system HicB family antitoxin n=1 Tax=Microbulbifer sp. 2205BS26-8 TaxID=3064386 RepID=UPI00273D3B87|nr:type II toxin-antitoxin system HicB family antitoxin [Microbulbifer sp. 2205BS26-8]MDP5209680.1 type II toxin-antitoxin system HicB family antitoxin [Microbulbifer sp. 2205BS26-8]
MRYPVVLHNIEHAGFGAIAPDLPHCHCHAETLDDTLQKMAETMFQRLEDLRLAGQPVPRPQAVDTLRENPAFAGGIWAIIDVASA